MGCDSVFFVLRGSSGQTRVHHKNLVTWENQPQNLTGSKSLGDTGFLQLLGLFQVIMANPETGWWNLLRSFTPTSSFFKPDFCHVMP